MVPKEKLDELMENISMFNDCICALVVAAGGEITITHEALKNTPDGNLSVDSDPERGTLILNFEKEAE